ncbi:hypothetical protein ACTVNX_15515 [Serratia nevei]|nr:MULTISPECIES: hypothetical protein [Serratia]MBH2873084.1 hypothetical protein [Serratia marcescens]MBI6127726.1 hypothetical protein [Serratia marcescens]MBN5184332.1 hypothetical protein [Serratia marcescens]MBN5193912.1 hypothetical protein [Serratia marcescens]MBN5303470.1 hypothetical protein [Serratia marcescens]
MSEQYGWQVLDDTGNLRYDQNTIMSRWLGSYDVPYLLFFNNTPPFWQHRITGIAFNGGTPYAFVTPTAGAKTPEGWGFAYSIPDVYCGPDFVEITFDGLNMSYPDDTVGVGNGLMTVHWGVYNA